MILGSRFDAQFGPLVVVGIGGTGVEIYQDVAICIAPVTGAQATSALASLKGARLLQGHRGQPPVDLAALSRLVVAFSQLVYELADRVESVDLNPVLCSAEGVLIADARIMLP
jgi:acyl-CoA synthetase (NDP forming)